MTAKADATNFHNVCSGVHSGSNLEQPVKAA